jgi:ParB-like chromosome segregation protein Spo0J
MSALRARGDTLVSTTPHLYQLFDALPAHIEDALRASIERFGVLVPVVRDQHGNVIDGHHRARLADSLGVKYRVDVVSVDDEDEAREIARTLNADRRQLTEEQRRQIVRVLREQGHSVRAIAGALGVGKSTVADDAAQLSAAGQLEQPDRVRGLDGKSRPGTRPTIVAAKNEREAERAQEALSVLGADTPSVPVLDVKRAERAAREVEADRRRAEPTEAVTVAGVVDIRHGDFREALAGIPDGSVDAVITDPPYPGEFRPLFGDLSALAFRVLTPNGVLAVMCGQYYLPDYISLLSEHMAYRWCGAYIAQGARTRVHAAKVGTGWKPILIFQHRDADPAFILDDLFDSTGDDKRHHRWGQSESGTGALVERLTQPGALVVDPFLGGGTTAVVCRDLGRRFIGCDIDAAHVATSRERVA